MVPRRDQDVDRSVHDGPIDGGGHRGARASADRHLRPPEEAGLKYEGHTKAGTVLGRRDTAGGDRRRLWNPRVPPAHDAVPLARVIVRLRGAFKFPEESNYLLLEVLAPRSC